MGNRPARLALLEFGLILTITGIATLYRGLLGWHNYWGGFVFAPFGVIVGLLMIAAAFKRPSKRKRSKDRSGFAWGKGNVKSLATGTPCTPGQRSPSG